MKDIADIFIIGGGINGVGIAADAAGRGLSVILCEQNDLASGTSSKSTKLIHGGLRYLEYYDFGLVKKALKEREVLLNNAPHIIEPLKFLLPLHKDLRPAWLIRLGLFIYDHLGGRKILAPTKSVNLKDGPYKDILNDNFSKAYEYSDCRVDDARLVILNAMTARNHGAEIYTYCRCVSAIRADDHWQITTQNSLNHQQKTIKAKMIINAAGPWIDHVIEDVIEGHDATLMRLVKGSHIIVNKLYDHDKAYIFQGGDERIIFAIPYRDKYTLIGTTDREYNDDLTNIDISKDEIDYLCQMASVYFKKPVKNDDIIEHFAGVRPLYDDGATAAQEAKRDFVLKLDKDKGAPILHIIGGKITTYRVLAEKTCRMLKEFFPDIKESWTETSPLPGGNFKYDDYQNIQDKLSSDFPFLDEKIIFRYMKNYGTNTRDFLKGAGSMDHMGHHFGHGLYEVEVKYLVQQEWAMTADDILWRRSKLGLEFNMDQKGALVHWMAGKETI